MMARITMTNPVSMPLPFVEVVEGSDVGVGTIDATGEGVGDVLDIVVDGVGVGSIEVGAGVEVGVAVGTGELAFWVGWGVAVTVLSAVGSGVTVAPNMGTTTDVVIVLALLASTPNDAE
jgi:hypothetical protein